MEHDCSLLPMLVVLQFPSHAGWITVLDLMLTTLKLLFHVGLL